jgi:MFS transporter, SP family, sugar:H+ symporter
MAGGVAIPMGPATDDDVPTEGSRTYAIIVCLFASLGGIFFGYDQGVTGGVLVMDAFLEDFCVGYGGNTYAQCTAPSKDLPDNWLSFTTNFNLCYYTGCIAGAFIAGLVADKFGRRWSIFLAGVLFCAGTAWVVGTPAHKHSLELVGRFVQGMGVGNSSFAIPIFGAEMAPKELRGMLSGFMQMTVVTGLFLANVFNIIVQDWKHAWRITFSIALVPPVVVMLGIFFVPESPRWMYKHKGREAAEVTLKKLRQTENVGRELNAIGDQLELEGDEVAWKELLEPSIRHRVFIAIMLQLLQQATGINPVFTYGAQIFKDVVGDGIMSLLILSLVNFLSTMPAMRWVDTVGRRKLLLIGAAGMCVGHIISAISFTVGCTGNTDNSGCKKAPGYIMVVSSCFYVFNFAMSWGPICWIYPAEIFPLNVRAKAVSLSSMANWVMGSTMIAIPKLFPYLNINGVFFLFFGLCACCGIFVYYFCPETVGLLLEDIEVLFNKKAAAKKAASPKYVEAQTPV